MKSLVPTLTLEKLKQNAKLIGKSLKELNLDISHSTVLNIAAQGMGYHDYNTAKALLEKEEISLNELADGMKRISITAVAQYDVPKEWDIFDSKSEGLLIKTGEKSYLAPIVGFLKNYINEDEDRAFHELFLPEWTEKERFEWEANRDEGLVSFTSCGLDEYPLTEIVLCADGAAEIRNIEVKKAPL